MVAVLLAACGGSGQPKEESIGAVVAALPANWIAREVIVGDFQPGARTGEVTGTFMARLAPREALAEQVDELADHAVLVVTHRPEVEVVLRGKLRGTREEDLWTVFAAFEPGDLERLKGRPESSFAPAVLLDSPEHAALRERLQAAARTRMAAEAEARRREIESRLEEERRTRELQEKIRSRQEEERRKEEEERAQAARLALHEKMLAWLTGLRRSEGLVLVANGVREWPVAVLEEVQLNESDLTAVLKGRIVASFPFRTCAFSARVVDLDRGRFGLDLVSEELPGDSLFFDQWLPNGCYVSSKRNGLYLDRMTAGEAESWRRLAALSDDSVAEPPTGEVSLSSGSAANQILSQTRLCPDRLIATCDTRVFDQKLEQVGLYLNNGEKVTVRLPSAPVVRKVMLMTNHREISRGAGAAGAYMLVNGSRVLLPAVGEGGVLISVTLPEGTKVAEVEVGAFGHLNVAGVLLAEQ